jgi:hypothetical protein
MKYRRNGLAVEGQGRCDQKNLAWILPDQDGEDGSVLQVRLGREDIPLHSFSIPTMGQQFQDKPDGTIWSQFTTLHSKVGNRNRSSGFLNRKLEARFGTDFVEISHHKAMCVLLGKVFRRREGRKAQFTTPDPPFP